MRIPFEVRQWWKIQNQLGCSRAELLERIAKVFSDLKNEIKEPAIPENELPYATLVCGIIDKVVSIEDRVETARCYLWHDFDVSLTNLSEFETRLRKLVEEQAGEIVLEWSTEKCLAVKKVIDRLPPNLWTPFVLYGGLDCPPVSVAKIAEKLEMSPLQVLSRVKRARYFISLAIRNIWYPPRQRVVSLIPDTDVQMIFKHVSDLDLSVRTENVLYNHGFLIVGEIVQRTEAQLLKLQGMGRKSLKELRELLAESALSFGMTLPPELAEEVTRRKKACKQ